MQRLALFDIDCTLIDAHGAGGRAIFAAIEETYGVSGALDGYTFHGRTDPAIVRDLALKWGVDTARVEAAVDDPYRDAKTFYTTYGIVTFIGAVIVLAPNAPLVTILVGTQVLNAVLLVPLMDALGRRTGGSWAGLGAALGAAFLPFLLATTEEKLPTKPLRATSLLAVRTSISLCLLICSLTLSSSAAVDSPPRV